MTVKGLQTFSITLNSIISISAIFLGLVVTFQAIRQLSLKQTSGLENGFVDEGLYRFSRNPQVLGNLITLFGVTGLLRTFEPVLVSFITGLWLITMVFSEAIWLDQEYTEPYRTSRGKVPRFI
jgi:protein-S-isoprenylcysteine O-methyltransferase Ste14